MNQQQCRRCSVCEGQKHHWFEDDTLALGPHLACQHCDAAIPMSDETTWIETSDGSHTFYFVCEGCGCEGAMGVPTDRINPRIYCPEDCGAVYILWNNPLKGTPDLKCVVCPVFE